MWLIKGRIEVETFQKQHPLENSIRQQAGCLRSLCQVVVQAHRWKECQFWCTLRISPKSQIWINILIIADGASFQHSRPDTFVVAWPRLHMRSVCLWTGWENRRKERRDPNRQTRGRYCRGCSDLLDLMSYDVCFKGTSRLWKRKTFCWGLCLVQVSEADWHSSKPSRCSVLSD